MFKALADDTRVKVAYIHHKEELCVREVASTGRYNSNSFHHLRSLKNLGLAKYRKEGKLVFYSLDDEHVRQLIELMFIHSKEVAESMQQENDKNVYRVQGFC
ncbi:winged helix-turn-helix transcriptional regulator [Anaerobacillus sp. HL2]|nr:winged helix-turn-helix transcriptional regulator [Anaerobacillus sp. HL2]